MTKRIYTIPVLSALNTLGPWLIKASSDADAEFSFALGPPTVIKRGNPAQTRRQEIIRDVFDVRDKVFKVRTPEDAVALFSEFGPWQIAEKYDNKAAPIKLSALLRRRKFYEDALLYRPVDNLGQVFKGPSLIEGLENLYLWSALPLELFFGDPPEAHVVCRDIEDALRASVFLDRLDGFVWRRCRREGCGKLFRLKSKREKFYCSTECAHLQSVRDYNKRKKSARKPAKPAAKKGRR